MITTRRYYSLVSLYGLQIKPTCERAKALPSVLCFLGSGGSVPIGAGVTYYDVLVTLDGEVVTFDE